MSNASMTETDLVRRIRALDAGRDPERLRLKYAAMRHSAFAFLRGTCAFFHGQLPRSDVLDRAPLAWSCGDLHLENFGSYQGDDQKVYFDIDDFDEAALVPSSWDVLRLLGSLQVAAPELSIDAAEATRLGGIFIDTWASSLHAATPSSVDRATAQGVVKDLLDHVRHRERSSFLDSRTRRHGKTRQLDVTGGKALPASDSDREKVSRFLAAFAATQTDPTFFELVDVARRVAGLGSLGVARFVVLVRGSGSPDGNELLDLKLASPSALAPVLEARQPAWATQAQRVVGIQKLMQAAPPSLLQAVLLDGAPYVLRSLQPSEDRVGLGKAGRTAGDLAGLIGTMAEIVAWDQRRSASCQGSASADAVLDFACASATKMQLLAAAEAAAQQIRRDAALFNHAYDDKAFAEA